MDNGVFFAINTMGAQSAPNMQIGHDLADTSTGGAFWELLEKSVIGLDSPPLQQDNLVIPASYLLASIICEEPLTGEKSLLLPASPESGDLSPVGLNFQRLPSRDEQAPAVDPASLHVLFRQLAQLLRSSLATTKQVDEAPIAPEANDTTTEAVDTAAQLEGAQFLPNIIPPAALPSPDMPAQVHEVANMEFGQEVVSADALPAVQRVPVVSLSIREQEPAKHRGPVDASSTFPTQDAKSNDTRFLPLSTSGAQDIIYTTDQVVTTPVDTASLHPKGDAVPQGSEPTTAVLDDAQTAIHISAPGLGLLHMKWSTDEAGHTVATIQTENAHAHTLLQEHADVLHQALTDAGVLTDTPIQINITQRTEPGDTPVMAIRQPESPAFSAQTVQAPAQQQIPPSVTVPILMTPASQPQPRRKSSDTELTIDLSRPLTGFNSPDMPDFIPAFSSQDMPEFVSAFNNIVTGETVQDISAADTRHPWNMVPNANRQSTGTMMPEIINLTSHQSHDFNESLLSQFSGQHIPNISASPRTAATSMPEQSTSAFVPQVILEQITNALRVNTKGIQRELDIQLDPPELGSVHVRVTAHASGELIARIQASDPAVRDMLQSHLQQLRQAFADNGFDLERCTISLDINAGQRQQQGGQPDQQTWHQGTHLPEIPGGDELVLDTPLHPTGLRDQSALDYFA
ncbi:MAG: flagellar hook-length control protein FliK [Armatimonadota bacterium]